MGLEDEEWMKKKCKWLKQSECKLPLNDGENMPNGCSAKCQARLKTLYLAEERERENRVMYQ